MTKHAVYLRLSKTKGATEATEDSFDAQRETVHAFMRAQGVDPAEALEFSDVISARKVRSADRPGWRAMQERIESGEISTIWARHPDRLYRHLSDLESLVTLVEAHGVNVRTAWSGDVDLTTSSGRTAARITGAIAQGEVETMQERVKARLAANRAAGKPHGGGRPFGWNRDGTIREDEAAIIRNAAEKIIAGESLRSVAQWCIDSGAVTDKGNPVGRANLHHILRSPRLIGQTIHKGAAIGSGLYEPILDEETYGALQGVLSDPARRKNGSVQTRGAEPLNLLTQIAVCGTCGATMNATTAKDVKGYDPARGKVRQGTGKTYRRYKCRNKCTSISRDMLDKQAVAAMVRFWMNADPADFAPNPNAANEIKTARAELAKIETERAQIVKLLASGLLDANESENILTTLNERRQTAQKRVESLAQASYAANTLAPIVADNVADFDRAAALTAAFTAQPLERQRQQLQRVWRPVVRHATEVGATEVTVNGETIRETVSGVRKQERRTVWECIPLPHLSFDPLEEDRAQIFN